jgi:sortase (surface protein transpeptidase)
MIQPARRWPTGPWLLLAALALAACTTHDSAALVPASRIVVASTSTVPPTRVSTTTVAATTPPTGPTTDASTTTADPVTSIAGTTAPAAAVTIAPTTVVTGPAGTSNDVGTTPDAGVGTVPTSTTEPPVKPGAYVNADADVGDPISISIPSIGVESLLVPTGDLPDGTMAVPTDASIAGWFTGGPKPGERGPAVIMGHLDQKTTGPGVFWHLRDLHIGAEVTIHTTTGDLVFVAVESDLIEKDEFPTDRVYGAVPTPVLRLITCGGSFDRKIGHYRSNVVVYLVPKVAP